MWYGIFPSDVLQRVIPTRRLGRLDSTRLGAARAAGV
jgi:hypothetical protein